MRAELPDNSEAAAAAKPGAIGSILLFQGAASRNQYLLWLGAELIVLLGGIAALAGLNNPTGGGSAPIAIIFPLAALYMHLCIVTARLRDTGVAHPVLLGIPMALFPFVWLGATAEFIERAWPVILVGFALLYFGPALPKSKAAEPQ